MIFELSHENIRTALQEYMDKRNIIQGKQFSFYIKTSRKGTKTSRAVIETLEDVSDKLGSVTIEKPLTASSMLNCMEAIFDGGTEQPDPSPMELVQQIIKTTVPEINAKAEKEKLVKEFFVKPVTETEVEVVIVASEEGTKSQPFKKLFQ